MPWEGLLAVVWQVAMSVPAIFEGFRGISLFLISGVNHQLHFPPNLGTVWSSRAA